MSFARYADTNFQEETLIKIERYAKKMKFRLRVGAKIGKHPQTVILDHNYQDALIYVNSDGDIKINGDDLVDFNELKQIIKDMNRKEKVMK